MIDRLSLDGRTVLVHAAVGGFAFGPDDLPAANRALAGHIKLLLLAGPQFLQNLLDVGNDVAGPADNDRIADPDAEPLYLVFVVQGRPADGDPADLDRLKEGNRGQGPGPADRNDYVLDRASRFPGRELVGNGPAGRFADRAELPEGLVVVKGHDYPVHFVIELFPGPLPTVAEPLDLP